MRKSHLAAILFRLDSNNTCYLLQMFKHSRKGDVFERMQRLILAKNAAATCHKLKIFCFKSKKVCRRKSVTKRVKFESVTDQRTD